MNKKDSDSEYLECERWWVFAVLMCVGGYFGAFTYTLRGGVFCNAQTGNFVLCAVALGNMQLIQAAYYLIPMSAYFAGAIVSEAIPNKIKSRFGIRWDTVLVGVEIIFVIFLGLLPEEAPYQISQVAVNFICSMQYNTFRQADGIPMATTFCTNHLRQTGIYLKKWICKKERNDLSRMLSHVGMICLFISGAVVSTILCNVFKGRAIWGAAVLLGIAFFDLLHADLTKEKGLMCHIPAGH